MNILCKGHYYFMGYDAIFILNYTDLKLHLQSTNYGSFLANEPSPLSVSTIDEKLREKLVVEFEYVRNHSYEELATFLDYIK